MKAIVDLKIHASDVVVLVSLFSKQLDLEPFAMSEKKHFVYYEKSICAHQKEVLFATVASQTIKVH